MDTFLNTEVVVPEKIDLDGLNKVFDDWHRAFVCQFGGVPVRIDDTLEGGQYYIAVSRELHERLKVENSHAVPICTIHKIKKVSCPCGCGEYLCPDCEVERVKREIREEYGQNPFESSSPVPIGVPERP